MWDTESFFTQPRLNVTVCDSLSSRAKSAKQQRSAGKRQQAPLRLSETLPLQYPIHQKRVWDTESLFLPLNETLSSSPLSPHPLERGEISFYPRYGCHSSRSARPHLPTVMHCVWNFQDCPTVPHEIFCRSLGTRNGKTSFSFQIFGRRRAWTAYSVRPLGWCGLCILNILYIYYMLSRYMFCVY